MGKKGDVRYVPKSLSRFLDETAELYEKKTGMKPKTADLGNKVVEWARTGRSLIDDGDEDVRRTDFI